MEIRSVLTVSILALSLALSLVSQAASADDLHPWVVPAPRLNKTAYFSNLSDGARIETPFLLKFGLTGVGLSPIVKAVPGTGHHHLLVNHLILRRNGLHPLGSFSNHDLLCDRFAARGNKETGEAFAGFSI